MEKEDSSGCVCKMMVAHLWLAGFTTMMPSKASTLGTVKHGYPYGMVHPN